MTENVGDCGLRFEIWFRRRRKSQDTYILQANAAETKIVWTNIIGKILWRQALRNRGIPVARDGPNQCLSGEAAIDLGFLLRNPLDNTKGQGRLRDGKGGAR